MIKGRNKREGFSEKSMIDLTQSEFGILILSSLACGTILGLVYDFIRGVRLLLGIDTGKTAVDMPMARRILCHVLLFILDFSFWIAFGLCAILLMYNEADGFFRAVVYVAMGIGFLAYSLTLGRFIRIILFFLIKKLKKLLNFVLRVLLRPIKAMIFAVISLYHLTIGRFIGKIISSIVDARQKRILMQNAEVSVDEVIEKGKEDFVYVDGKIGYRKNERISFGTHRRN